MLYPTKEQVNNADKLTICRWYRFLPSPHNASEKNVLIRISERLQELGGFTHEISKQLGYKNHYL